MSSQTPMIPSNVQYIPQIPSIDTILSHGNHHTVPWDHHGMSHTLSLRICRTSAKLSVSMCRQRNTCPQVTASFFRSAIVHVWLKACYISIQKHNTNNNNNHHHHNGNNRNEKLLDMMFQRYSTTLYLSHGHPLEDYAPIGAQFFGSKRGCWVTFITGAPFQGHLWPEIRTVRSDPASTIGHICPIAGQTKVAERFTN